MSYELDFIDALTKTSGAVDSAKALGSAALKKIVGNPVSQAALKTMAKHPKITAGALGAAVTGGVTYAASKGKKTTPGSEKWVAGKLEDSAAKTDELKDQGVEPSFRKEIAHAAAPGVSRIADVLHKHPGKAALFAAPAGALAGLKILKSLQHSTKNKLIFR